MTFHIAMQDRAFHETLVPPFPLQVERLAWHALGGPEVATLSGTAEPWIMEEAMTWLRRPIVIHWADQPAWWGYVAEVELNTGRRTIGVSLDSMVNYVAVAYSYVEPGTNDVGTRATTSWAYDETSQSVYGFKQKLLSIDGASVAQAEAYRDTYLAQHRFPQAFVRQDGESEHPSVRLTCRGWWDTLAWRYYSNPNTSAVALTTQIENIVAAVSEHLTATHIVTSLATTSNEYQDGDSTAQDVIGDLLKAGSGRKALLASVTRERQLRISVQPDSADTNLLYTMDAQVLDAFGNPLYGSPAGQWCDLESPALFDLAYVFSPSPFLIERAEYNVDQGRWRLEPWGGPDPWQLARTTEG